MKGRAKRYKWPPAGPGWPTSRESYILPGRSWKKCIATADHYKASFTDSRKHQRPSSRLSRYYTKGTTTGQW
eukprot:scaffold21585_cov92-Cylindrotheca_fusiformis.AAC.1